MEVFERVLKAERVVGRERWSMTRAYPTAVFLTFDDYVLKFAAEAVRRFFKGQKTFALTLRSEAIAEEPNLKRRIKKLILWSLSRLPGCQIITLSPPWLVPGMQSFTSGWIEDLQLWDLSVLKFEAPSVIGREIQAEILREAAGRKVILALGRQDLQKGVEFFVKLAERAELSEKFLFAMIGPIRDVPASVVSRFEAAGGYLRNEFPDEADLIGFYGVADLVWACYHPDYNVNSGIFGRSVQLGRASVVREGSLLAKMQGRYSAGLQLDYDKEIESMSKLMAWASSESIKAFSNQKPYGLPHFVRIFSTLK